MSKSTTSTGTPRPTRAEPIQPDRPGRGQDREKHTKPQPRDTATQQRKQSEQALENVREGYD